MLILNFFIIFVKILILAFYVVVYYVLILFKNFLFFIFFLPFSFLNIVKFLLLLLINLLNKLIAYLVNYFKLLFLNMYGVYVIGAFQQFSQHVILSSTILKNKFFRRYYFYRRFYRFYPNLKLLAKSISTVELNALLIKRLTQPSKSTLLKVLNLAESPTRIGFRFRVTRRLIKFTLGVLTMYYPLHLAVKYGFWYLTGYLLNFLRFLRRKEILKTKKSTIIFLKFIIWLKLIFVWSELPFVMLFKPGFSKKYPQYEDIKPDTKVIKPEVWDFAVSRDCYFDYDDVLNGYYVFHYFRNVSKAFFNGIVLILVFIYFFIKSVLYALQILYLLIYIPFKFLYFQSLLTFILLLLKLLFVFIYLIPVVSVLMFFLILYVLLKFFFTKVKFFYNQSFIYFHLNPLLNLEWLYNRLWVIAHYLIFKLRSTNYFIFNNITRFISINNLFNLGSRLSSLFSGFFTFDSFYGNLLYYNSSFVFKRVRPYLLRFNNTQFLFYFLNIQNTSRITPDQFKAFYKISLNGQTPVHYFERLFDIEYSRLELEYELPYYWAFLRQAHSFNQGLLHPKFHVFGILNYLKFYWNYFSFLNSNTIFDLRSSQAHDFIQLLNSSVSRIFSYLMHDFFNLLKVKTFTSFSSNIAFVQNKKFIKLSESLLGTRWHSLHTKYYDKLLHFFWNYYDNFFMKLILYYYTISSSNKKFNSIRSYFNDYAEKTRHILGWLVFAFFERIMGKIFININKFEDYYDVNFDKSIDQYDFYLTHLKKFLGLVRARRTKIASNSDTPSSSNENDVTATVSIRISDYLDKITSNRRKDYTNLISDFFTGSFSFFGHFYIFVRDNVFEFMAEWHTVWRDYIDSSITRWYNSKKIILFIFYFLKIFITLCLIILFVLVFFLFFFLKKMMIIIVKKLKKLYV